MKVPNARPGEPLEVKMTPMIDVVFLLLIFFIWTSSFEEPEYDLPSSLAESPAGGAESATDEPPPVEVFDEIVIRILNQNGSVIHELNGQRVADLSGLRERLIEIIALGVQPPVIVDPAGDVTMGNAIEVYDVARAAGADRVLFAARERG